MFLRLSRITGRLFTQVSLTAANSLTCCCLLGVCVSFHTPFFLHAQHIIFKCPKISKMPELNIYFSLAHPFSSSYQFPLLFSRIAAQKEELHKMFAVPLQNVFIKLETIMQTSSTPQFQDTEGTFSTLANSHHLLLFIQCAPVLHLF